jgi:nitroreductase
MKLAHCSVAAGNSNTPQNPDSYPLDSGSTTSLGHVKSDLAESNVSRPEKIGRRLARFGFFPFVHKRETFMAYPSLNADQLVDSLKWRYAVKRFDPARSIDPQAWAKLEESLVLTPSSFGLQPWKFLVVQSAELKAKLPSISWNQPQPNDCSHMVVFASMKSVSVEYIDRFLETTARVRNVPVEGLAPYRQIVLGFLKNIAGHELAWSSKQAYIALGQLMASAAVLGIDACPMEGIIASEYDQLLGLAGTNYTCVVCCAMGYRHAEDKYATLAKIRFPLDEVISRL